MVTGDSLGYPCAESGAAESATKDLIDATNPFGYGHCLPRGLLREPVSALRDADAVKLTGTELSRPVWQLVVEMHVTEGADELARKVLAAARTAV